jgi:hypothetical protein
MGMPLDGNLIFSIAKFFGAPLILPIQRASHFHFSSFSFQCVGLWLFWAIGAQHFKERGGGTPCIIFCYFCDFNYFCKMKYVEQSN